MLSHWYDPETGGAAGPGTIARALQQRGHEVDVVTGYPIYPTGRLADGYRIRPYQREVMRGVTVHRSPIYPSHDTRPGHRMANYLSYAASGSAVAAAVLRRCDVVYVYSTPATTAIPGMALRALTRRPMVTHIQDLWPQTVTASGFLEAGDPRGTDEGGTADGTGARGEGGRVERVLHRFCDTVYRRSQAIAVTSPGMADLIEARGIPRERLHFVPNWAEETSFYPTAKDPATVRELGLTDAFTVMYAGNFGEMQQLDTVLDAAAELRDEPGLQIALVGGGVMADHVRDRVERERLHHVRVVGPQPFSRMSAILAVGDVQLVQLKDVPLYRSTLPSKLQANLAAGRPVIGGLTGDAADVVTASGGLVYRPGDGRALAAAIREVRSRGPERLAEMGRQARAHYESTYSERTVGDRLECLLRETGASAS